MLPLIANNILAPLCFKSQATSLFDPDKFKFAAPPVPWSARGYSFKAQLSSTSNESAREMRQ